VQNNHKIKTTTTSTKTAKRVIQLSSIRWLNFAAFYKEHNVPKN